MNIAQIEEDVNILIAGLASGVFPQEYLFYEQLLAHGHRYDIAPEQVAEK